MALPQIDRSREGWALFLFTVQFVACLALVILYETVYQDNAHPLETFTKVLYSAAAAVFVVTATTVLIVEGLPMLAEKYLRRRYYEGMAVGEARGVAAGEARAKAEVNARWRAWYQRMLDAQHEGMPFDEPPPGDTLEEPKD